MNIWWRRQTNRWGYRLRKIRRRKFIFLSVILIMLVLLLGNYYFRTLRPVFTEVSGSIVRQKLENAINNAVARQLRDEGITYDSLVITEKNADGEITALKANTVLMNLIKAETAGFVNELISTSDPQDFSVPLGNFFGNEFLSGRGPNITVKAVPYGSCDVVFNSEFSDAGINQTRLKITMVVTAKAAIMPPVGAITYAEIVTSFPIGESVIVGKSPDTYANFNQTVSSPEESPQIFRAAGE